MAGLLASGTVFACTQPGGDGPKKSDKEDSTKDQDSSEEEDSEGSEGSEDSEKDEESEGDEESSSTGKDTDDDDEDETTKEDDSTKEEEDSTSKEDESTKEEDDSTSKEEDSSEEKDPDPDDDGECKVTAQWGDGKPFEAGTHVPNWEMNAVFDHNGDGKIEGDERTAKKITLEDVYCAKPRNKFAVITHSFWT